MRVVFTATTGRSGSDFLAYAVNTLGIRVRAEHEPPNLLLRRLGDHPFCRRHGLFSQNSRLVNLGRRLQRRTFASEERLGRGRCFQWLEEGHNDYLSKIVDWRLARIDRFRRRGLAAYLESSQFFLTTYWSPMVDRLSDLRVIKLTRAPLEMARSYANRQKDPFQSFPRPDARQHAVRLDNWRDLTPFQLYLHRWVEAEVRFERLRERVPAENTLMIETSELGEPEQLAKVFAFLGVDHRPILRMQATNRNQDQHGTATLIGAGERAEAAALIARLPANAAPGIAALARYGVVT